MGADGMQFGAACYVPTAAAEGKCRTRYASYEAASAFTRVSMQQQQTAPRLPQRTSSAGEQVFQFRQHIATEIDAMEICCLKERANQ